MKYEDYVKMIKEINEGNFFKENSFNQTQEYLDIIAMTNDEYDKFMCTRFPSFFAKRNLSRIETCMCWGFEIGNGWFPLLYEMCLKLECICNPYKIDLKFEQIKEKFGGGRFYYSLGIPNDVPELVENIIEEIISKYENKAYNICSETGVYYPDKISLGWVYDICPERLKERFKEDIKFIENVNAICEKNRIKEYIKQMLSSLTFEQLSSIKDFLNDIESKKTNGYVSHNPCD